MSLALTPGELIGIIGPNGAGKTTLLKALCGLVPISDGHVFLNDKLLECYSPSHKGREIAYVPQDRVLPYGMKLIDVVSLGRIPHFKTSNEKDDKDLINAILHELDLYGLRFQRAETLSGGEKARLCLARALAVNSCFLLLDEPTASLDPAQTLNVMSLLKRQALIRQKSVCVVLHDLSLAAQFCTKLIMLEKGVCIAQGTAQEVLTPALLQKLYQIEAEFIDNIPVLFKKHHPS
ncbi:ATP-binding cassette domain-containing protein [Aristophania vespae]|uniref:ATP-binding cassette domain-containing protein n=1 Tax=Aristophania vespae TaxID=2697033 RepID=A0A6P1NI56_9PROT|nr:ABC transporter ATP-binding protein [Aristophania vespae]QHI96214.1 ATP-binding cassette domain-containing protein [Aristophania vespae]